MSETQSQRTREKPDAYRNSTENKTVHFLLSLDQDICSGWVINSPATARPWGVVLGEWVRLLWEERGHTTGLCTLINCTYVTRYDRRASTYFKMTKLFRPKMFLPHEFITYVRACFKQQKSNNFFVLKHINIYNSGLSSRTIIIRIKLFEKLRISFYLTRFGQIELLSTCFSQNRFFKVL